jgi:hypothetical protein
MPLERPIEIRRTATRFNKLQNLQANSDFLARTDYEASPDNSSGSHLERASTLAI